MGLYLGESRGSTENRPNSCFRLEGNHERSARIHLSTDAGQHHLIEEAEKNKLVVGSQARILYADAEGRSKIAQAFNKAIQLGEISAPIVLGRDHHDVSGTDSPIEKPAISTMAAGSRPIWPFTM